MWEGGLDSRHRPPILLSTPGRTSRLAMHMQHEVPTNSTACDHNCLQHCAPACPTRYPPPPQPARGPPGEAGCRSGSRHRCHHPLLLAHYQEHLLLARVGLVGVGEGVGAGFPTSRAARCAPSSTTSSTNCGTWPQRCSRCSSAGTRRTAAACGRYRHASRGCGSCQLGVPAGRARQRAAQGHRCNVHPDWSWAAVGGKGKVRMAQRMCSTCMVASVSGTQAIHITHCMLGAGRAA